MYLSTPLAFLDPDGGGFPWDDRCKIFHGDQRIWLRYKWHRNIAENVNRLSRAQERYTTDDRQTDLRQHIPERNVVTCG